LHIEPYKDRTPDTVRGDLEYATAKYGAHPAYHKMGRSSGGGGGGDSKGGSSREPKLLPVFYVYDSYHNPAKAWRRLLAPPTKGGDPKLSIRGTAADAYVLFLMVERQHDEYARVGGFDGFYTVSSLFSCFSRPC
jgi:hypothetical protein